MDEELKNLIQGAKSQGASDNDIKRIIDLYIADSKKKGVTQPISPKKQLESPVQQAPTPTSLDTEETQPPAVSDGLGGPPKSFPKRDEKIKSVMYGDGMEQPNVLVQSLPLGEKPKKFYRLISDQKKEVDKKIIELEDRNVRLGRRPEDLAREGTYQSLVKTKQQLDEQFKPAERAIQQVKKETSTWTRPIEVLTSAFTDGKYTLANTETIKLNKDVEDKIIDSFDDAPEEIKQKWYKGSLPTDQKEKIINTAKVDVLNNTFKSLKQETSDYLENIKDNPNVSQEEKNNVRTNLVNKSNAFNAQVALDFSGNLLKNNFKATDEDKNLDEVIFSKYEGFIPETADMVSRFVEGVISTGGKALTGIPTLALLGAEQFNQFTGASKSEDYTPIEATIDLINDTTNYNFLPSSKSEEGAIVDKEGNLNLSYRSITRTLADTLPFTLKIMSDVKKGRVEGSPQSMVSQLLNPSKNKAFTDRLNVVETAYKVTVNDNYKDAKEIGMDDSKAFTYANVLSLAEGVSETIMPDFKYFDSLTGSTLKNVFKSNLKEAATKQAVKNVTKDFFKNAALELGEEEFVLAVEDGLKYSLLLNHKNSEFFNIKRQKELVAATVIMSGAMGSVAIPGKFKQNRTDIYREVYNNISDIQDTFINEINSPLNDDKAKESLVTAYKFANDISNAIANAPETVTADQVDLLVQKKKLEEKKKNIDTAFHPDINEEIAVIDTKIRELSKQTVATEEVVAPTEVVAEEVVTPTEEVVSVDDIEKRRIDTESKIKRKDLFMGVGDFSTQLGGSDISAVPFSHKENNGIELVEYAHPKTGSVDVIVTGKSENDFVGFYRIYENGKPTNKWSSKFNNESRNKEDFKTMISGVQALLPEGHEYTEKISISTDGLRVWNQQLNKGYELQYDENGNIITNTVAINGDAIVNELGIDVNKGDFENIKVVNNKDFNTVKKALLPYLEKFGLNESNIRNINGTVKIDLPVLKQSKKTEVTPTEVVTEKVVEPAPSLAKEYIQSIEKSKSESPEKFWSVDRPFQKEDGTIDEVQLDKAAEEGRIIKTESGFGVVGKDGDIKGVFKADLKSTEKTGDKVIQEAVKKGGIKLDNFALPNLMKIYERNGFREVSRLPFNEEYAPEGWTPEQGTPDVVAMVYDPNGELNIEKKSFTDYDEAMSYRDSYVKQKPTVKSKLAAFKTKYIDKPVYDRTKLDTQVENAKKSLSKLLPNVKFVVHDTKESFIGVSGKNARGYYDPATKTIHINSLEANARTVAHEVFHSVLLDKVKTDSNARELTKRMISSIAKTLEGNPDLKKTLDDFVKNYDENIQNEEKLSELFGYLADGYEGFDAPTKSVIKRAMDRLAKMFGLKPFTEGEIVDMLKTLSGKVATGEEIVSKDVKAISEGASSYISEPTNIERFSKTNEENVVVGDHKLSFVKESDLIDIDALMKDITAKKQNVWFWVADQLGRGNYFDKVIDGEHYLDAGPSFALDPKNRDRNVIWATGKEEKEITKLIGRSDYIFIISGSAQKSKLFNKKVFELFEKRIGNYASFKKEVLDSNPTKPMRDVLNAHNSWETLREDASVDNAKTKTIGTGRKKFLIALLDAMEKPKSKAYNTYQKRNAFVDVNDIRDGFYKDNNFNQNDIMLVLKPTKIGGKSEHSTYENDILGEVVGVPNIKVNAFDIMTPEVKDKYKKVLQITEQQQAVAPYGIGVKQIERFQESEGYSDMKDIVNDMIGDGMSITEIKKLIGTELGADQVSLAERAYNELTEEVITKEPTGTIEEFRDKVKDIPESGKVSKYLSGETIERVEGEAPRNIQDIDIMPLVEAGIHGRETVAMAKEVYGDKYIEKTLEFLDTANLKAHEKALLYVSLENEMFDLVNSEPKNVGFKKLQDLVRAKSQQFLRESSLAINMGRLRAIMKDGFNYESITDSFLSKDQLAGKKEVEKAIQSDANAIQNEYESMVKESDIEQLILSGVEKQINEIYKKLPTARKVKADKAIAALERIQKKLKGKAYDATIGLPIALIDSGITIIKNSIKAGVNIADAIELGINHIKEKYGKDWANEGMFRDDMTQGFKSEGVSEKEINVKDLSKKQIVDKALIDAGFGKEITVKKEKRKVLDWKKLAGEEGSVDKLKENVEKIIGKEAAKELEDEYNNLRASIIEKSLNELERRNIPRKKVNLKTSAKKLAEIYNYGAFEEDSDTYDQVMNTVLGMNQLDQESFNEAKKLARSLSELFSKKDKDGNPISQESLKQGERVINKKIERLLSKVAWSESNGLYKAVTIAKEYIGAAQRAALVSIGQAIENTMSGYVSRIYNKIGFSIDNVDTKSLKESRNKLARMTFKDITLGGGLEFGDVTSPFITKSKTMDLIQNASDSRLYHALTSTALGKPFLEAADSMHKSALTAKFFQYNLIKILRKKGYSKTEAKNYVSEQLTGQSFEDALVDSKKIIDEINQNSGKKVIPDTEESIYRFANDLVNESLIQGQKVNIEEIRAALKAAETVAGFELGHEPNNIVSKPLNLFNSWIQTRIDRAVKDKKWNDAAALTTASILSGNILNPFIGGGMNWTFLGMQKVGIPTPATMYWNIKARSNKLDISSDEGMKNLEQTLKYQLLAKNANTRVVIGATISLAAFALASATGADDDLYKWLKKNAWANKYFAKVSPPVVQYMVAEKNKKMSEFFGKQLNLKVDAFDEGKKIKQAIDNIASGKTQKALGGVGQLAGSRLSTPVIPWRLVRDVSDIYRGLNGLPAIKNEYKSSGFASGYFQGGMIEQIGLRPENTNEISDEELRIKNPRAYKIRMRIRNKRNK